MNRVFVISGRRTGISPKDGALANVPLFELAAQAAGAAFVDVCVDLQRLDGLFLGNALAAGGNPARAAALALGIPSAASWSIDTQCCSGLDAITLAADRIRAGSAHVLLAGGAESASQAPLRARRIQADALSVSPVIPTNLRSWDPALKPSFEPYEEADFTPWPEQEPSMVQAAVSLSSSLGDVAAEYAWAVRSHERTRMSANPERISGGSDTFTRELTLRSCYRGASHSVHNPTTMAPLADGAAMLLLVSEQFLTEWLSEREHTGRGPHPKAEGQNHKEVSPGPGLRVSEVLSTCQVGADPFSPGLAAHGLKHWFDQLRSEQGEPTRVELMESFAAQALLNMRALGFAANIVNINGGLLAMGHPVGASGAVLAARLHHGLNAKAWGLAVIPAAGGIASGLALRRVEPL